MVPPELRAHVAIRASQENVASPELQAVAEIQASRAHTDPKERKVHWLMSEFFLSSLIVQVLHI